MKSILVTGAAGFIGYSASKKLLDDGYKLIGIDNINDYYDTDLKRARLSLLKKYKNFTFHEGDITNQADLENAIKGHKLNYILHLAAQAGVRHSLKDPHAYIQSNVLGHLNILELARHTPDLEHLIYASSSSVYGDRSNLPFIETDLVRSPVSLYAATKLSGELLSESYHNLYKIPMTGLRFFTVYGPWGRPDMAYYIFTQKILNSEPITLFAPDAMRRDFTYIDNIVNVLPKIISRKHQGTHKVYNLGNSSPTPLTELVEAIERACGKKADIIIKPKQNGDVFETYADVTKAKHDFNFDPYTPLDQGILNFVNWYKNFRR